MTGVDRRGAPSGKPRVVFIDQARVLALFPMLIDHSLDRFLGDPWRSGAGYEHYQFWRGLSSVLFLMVAGFSFVIASFDHFDNCTQLSVMRVVMSLGISVGVVVLFGMVIAKVKRGAHPLPGGGPSRGAGVG